MAGVCEKCGQVIECDDCGEYVNVVGARFQVDVGIIEQFSEALIEQDKEKMESILVQVEHRMDGKCFCSAYSGNECMCGAW